MLNKTVGNWVDGDRFFNREDDLAALNEHVRSGTHTLLTAQRRMGKTSLVHELLRCLSSNPGIKTCFVDVEDAKDSADAIVEISVAPRPPMPIPGGPKRFPVRLSRESGTSSWEGSTGICA